MRIFPPVFPTLCRPRWIHAVRSSSRSLLTLAIETSCDDTSVALLEKNAHSKNGRPSAKLYFHKKITSDNALYQGVHPLVSLQSHQENLAKLIDEAVQYLPPVTESGRLEDGQRAMAFPSARRSAEATTRRLPDFISVTRGPGMRSNLFTGIDTAKGLAAAWQIDLVGVHHMQAHALTPRLVAALQGSQETARTSKASPQKPSLPAHIEVEPQFPFLSVLVSGGHTLLIHSVSLTDHKVMASTNDIAIGECLDKIARVVLPSTMLASTQSTMYGPLLEQFAFPKSSTSEGSNIPWEQRPATDEYIARERNTNEHVLENDTASQYASKARTTYANVVSATEEEAVTQNKTKWGWAMNKPLSKSAGGLKSKSLEMSFSGFLTYVQRLVQCGIDPSTGKLNKHERVAGHFSMEERRDIARESMRAAFEHVASRVLLGLQKLTDTPGIDPVKTVVFAGGVAANSYFRYILASTLALKGYPDLRMVFPPPSLCTDNAAMIAWAGIEMYSAGHIDSRTIRAIRKWPLNQLLAPPEIE